MKTRAGFVSLSVLLIINSHGVCKEACLLLRRLVAQARPGEMPATPFARAVCVCGCVCVCVFLNRASRGTTGSDGETWAWRYHAQVLYLLQRMQTTCVFSKFIIWVFLGTRPPLPSFVFPRVASGISPQRGRRPPVLSYRRTEKTWLVARGSVW